jgi:hypothetical protein
MRWRWIGILFVSLASSVSAIEVVADPNLDKRNVLAEFPLEHPDFVPLTATLDDVSYPCYLAAGLPFSDVPKPLFSGRLLSRNAVSIKTLEGEIETSEITEWREVVGLQIGSHRLEPTLAIVFPGKKNKSTDLAVNLRAEGSVGAVALEQSIIQLDFDNRKTRLLATYRPTPNDTELGLVNTPHGTHIYISARMPILARINTVYCNGLMLDEEVYSEALSYNGLLSSIEYGPSETYWLPAATYAFKEIRLGGLPVKNVLARRWGWNGVDLGVLSQFQVVLNYRARKVYLSPRRNRPPEMVPDACGIDIDWTEKGAHVRDVRVDCAAREAGIRIGDRILRIDGIPTEKLTTGELGLRLSADGHVVTLLIERSEEKASPEKNGSDMRVERRAELLGNAIQKEIKVALRWPRGWPPVWPEKPPVKKPIPVD